MTIDRNTIYVLVAAFVLGWWWASPSHDNGPLPGPHPNRPVVSFLARIARLGLWVMLAGEQPPSDHSVQLVHAKVGADGEPMLDHGAGW